MDNLLERQRCLLSCCAQLLLLCKASRCCTACAIPDVTADTLWPSGPWQLKRMMRTGPNMQAGHRAVHVASPCLYIQCKLCNDLNPARAPDTLEMMVLMKVTSHPCHARLLITSSLVLRALPRLLFRRTTDRGSPGAASGSSQLPALHIQQN